MTYKIGKRNKADTGHFGFFTPKVCKHWKGKLKLSRIDRGKVYKT